MSQNIINHVALVLDASYSMNKLSEKLVQVADLLIADLARLSKDMDQETRVTVYTFDDHVSCVIYDKDVLRLPSIREHYKVRGNTALLRATSDAIDDLHLTATKYGDHSFLVYVLTDGVENASNWDFSKNRSILGLPNYKTELPQKIKALPENWTLACFVPDARHIFATKQYGFPAGNIAVWDTSERGMEEVASVVTTVTTSYMTSRASGVRGTKSLFQTNVGAIDTSAVQAVLTPLDINSYVLSPVLKDTTTSEFVAEYQQMHPDHKIGDVFYQLTGSKPTKGKRGIIVQGHKPVAVMERSSGRIYTGSEARKLVGLPDHTVTVDPTDEKGDYMLFVRSDAPNRILYPNTKFLMMKK